MENDEFRETLDDREFIPIENNSKKKHLILGIIIILILIVITIILFIILVNEQNKKEKSKGEIICIYNVTNNNQKIKILGDEMKKNLNIGIYINGTKIQFSNEYTFENKGNNEIKYILYENINMDYMFKGITDLLSVEIKSQEHLEITSMINTFENCTNLEAFKIDGLKIAKMNNAFYNSGLKEIYLKNIDIKDMSFMFSSSNAKNITIEDIHSDNVVNMSYMFYNCSALENLNINYINTNKVEDMSYMFKDCSSLKSLNLILFNTDSVKDMSNMFNGCKSLVSLDI